MDSGELLAVIRDELGDTESPYVVSDAALLRYIDEAQKNFCRWTEGIEESRDPEITKFSLTPGGGWLELSPLILKVRAAVDAQGRDIPVVGMELAPQMGITFDGRSGHVKALVAGLQRGMLRAWPSPSAPTTVRLSVFRLPLEPITTAGAALEIEEQHHEALLLWVKHRVYGRDDLEASNATKSQEYEARFRTYCATAFKEQERARRNSGVVMYGGL